MTSFLIAIASIIAFFALLQFWMRKKSRRSVGKEIPAVFTSEKFFSGNENKILFFYSPNCGPCKQMMPDLDKISDENPYKIKKVNVGQSLDLARALKIMATPTTVLINSNKVVDVKMGLLKRNKLLDLLQIT